jgi:hypothetical protein
MFAPEAVRPECVVDVADTGWRASLRHARGERTTWWWAWPAGFTAAGIGLFFCYLRVSGTQRVTSDGASNAVQAWDMLHGNLLLHGWTVTDVSFYTTELPQYASIELIRGFGPGVVHVGAAMTYTLLVLLAGLLAKGRAVGREGVVRVLIASGIMLAPQVGPGAFILLLSPDHIGTQVPLLMTWLVLDRARRRWYVPAVIGLMLAWVQIADRIVVIAAVAPLVLVSGVRVYQGLVQRREVLAGGSGGPPSRASTVRWFELSLAAAGMASVAVASFAVKLIRDHGGYAILPVRTTLADASSMSAHTWLTAQGVLGLYGADFFQLPLGVQAGLALLHLAGVAMAVWAVWLGVRRFFDSDDLIVQVLTIAVLANLAAYMFSTLPGAYWGTRQIAGVLPTGAVLAGRLLGGRLTRARLVPAMSAVLVGYAFALGYGVMQPSVAATGEDLAGWLAAHHLSYGLGDYGEANSITLASGGRVELRSVVWQRERVIPGPYEFNETFYNPRLYYANFVVLPRMNRPSTYLAYSEVRAAFGPPERTYHVTRYVVMTWDKNLLTHLRRSPTEPTGGPDNPGTPRQNLDDGVVGVVGGAGGGYVGAVAFGPGGEAGQ